MAFTVEEFSQNFQNLGIKDPQVGDPVVADHISTICPPGTYSSISVQSKPYHFKFTPQEETHQSRVIVFEPTHIQAAWHLLASIFQQTHPTINGTRAVLGVLGSRDRRDQAAVFQAFKQNHKISIYAAMDGFDLFDYS